MKKFSSFITEAMENSVTVRGVDDIPRINRIEFRDYTPNSDRQNDIIFSGAQQDDFSDILGSIISPEDMQRLQYAYGPNWTDLVKQKVAELPRVQPNTQRPQSLDDDAEALYNTIQKQVSTMLDRGYGYS